MSSPFPTPEIAPPVALYVPHTRQNKNLQIQWLRLIAALCVVVFHASALAKVFLHDDRFMKIFDGRFGLFGVSLFFSISGYLMAVAIRVQKPFLFLSHRVIRIYPLLWISYGLYYLSYYLLRPHTTAPHLFFQDMMLAPHGDVQGVFGVEWSLVYEVTFYVLMFAIGLAGLATRLTPIALAWLGAIVIGTILNYQAEPNLIVVQQILIHPASVGLGAGLLIPRLLALRVSSWLYLLIGCVLIVFAPADHDLDITRWFYGIGTSSILAGAIALSTRRPDFGDTFLGRGFAKAADCTYALYLCHMPVVIFLYQSGLHLAVAVEWVTAIGASLAVAFVLGSGEMKLYQRLKAAVNNASPKLTALSMIGFLIVFGSFSIAAGYQQQTILNRNGKATHLAQDLRRAAGADTQSVDTIMSAAGYRKADDLTGEVNGVIWKNGFISVWGWALDKGADDLPLGIVFQGSSILGGTGIAAWRHDIERQGYTKRRMGFEFKVPAVCQPGSAVSIVVVSADRRYAVLTVPGAAGCP